MGNQRTTFDKLQRERAKKAKQAAKRERRQQRNAEPTEQAPEMNSEAAEHLSAPQLLQEIEVLHKRFEAGLIEFEDFEERKTELFEALAALPVE